MKHIFSIIVSLIFMFNINFANAETPTLIKSETKELILEIKYPQGFAKESINEEIKHLIEQLKKANMPEVDANLPADIPGKNGLYIDYKIVYQNERALSLLFTVSAYMRGAAHPNNSLETLNFIDGKKISFAELFKKDTDYLNPIATICKNALMKKDFSNDELIIEGTKPAIENYQNWNFSKEGLVITFKPYQVAAYVYGAQDVLIPKAKLNALMLPEITKAIWGN